MARRRRQSTAEDAMDLVAMLPWWAGVGLAVLSYVVLHRLAAPPTVAALQPGQVGGLMLRSMVAGLAMAGQFIVPVLCLFGALGSFLRRNHREALVRRATNSSATDAIQGMSWREFELLVGEAFRLQGYAVTEQGGAGPDGGVDLTLRKGSETFLVQCKQWKAYKVGVDVVRQLYGVMAARGAAGGFVVTSGTFTTDAQAFAQGRNVRLVDGAKLAGLLHQAKSANAAKTATWPAADRPGSVPVAPLRQPSLNAEPACPICQGGMIRRTAKKGINVGSQFWGCAKFPACRGTR